MDKQKQIEKMAKIMLEKAFENYETTGSVEIDTEVRRNFYSAFLVYCEALYNAGYRKIPENAVVLTANEQVDRWIDLLVEFDEMGFEPTTLPPKEMSAEEYAAFWKDRVIKFFVNARKETAEKFAERLKQIGELHYHFGEQRYDIATDDIDEICEEITEGKV